MRWFLGASVLLTLGLMFRLGLMVYAMYVLLAVLLVSRYLARAWIENLSANRSASGSTVEIGETVAVTLTICNRSRLPIPWMLLEDSIPREAITQKPPRITIKGRTLHIIQLTGRSETQLDYLVNCLMRGYYQLGPLLVESGDLFGLQRRYKVLTEPHFLLVMPKIVPLEGYDLASRLPIGEVRMTHRLFEDPTRISGIRPYEKGDPLNRVHWRATARTGSLQSKLYDPSSISGATFLLDFHRDSYPSRGQLYRSELAVTTVASLANVVHQMGQQVGFITNGRDMADRIRQEGWTPEFHTRALAKAQVGMLDQNDRLRPVIVQTRRGTDQFMRILEILARIELTDGIKFPQLVEETASRLPRNASIVAVLSDVEDETAIALGGLRRRGYAVTAVLAMFDEEQHPEWASKPEWASWLLAAGVEVRRVDDEAALSSLCAKQLIR